MSDRFNNTPDGVLHSRKMPMQRPSSQQRQYIELSNTQGHSPNSILKRKGSQFIDSGGKNVNIGNDLTQMRTINEDQTATGEDSIHGQSKTYSQRGSVGNTLEESLRDPSRPPQMIEGITDFLIDEHRKRIGIYCEDSKKLFSFWKNYVSAYYKNEKLKKIDMKQSIKRSSMSRNNASFADFEFEFVEREETIEIGLGPYANSSFSKFIPLPKSQIKKKQEDSQQSYFHSTRKPSKKLIETQKRNSKSPLTKYLRSINCNSKNHACEILHAFNYQQPHNTELDQRDEKCYLKRVEGPRASSALKMTSKLNIQGHVLKMYDIYSKQFEMDVMFTLEKDCNKRSDQQKQEQMAMQNSIQQKQAFDKLKSQLKKCDNVLKVYYDYKLEKELHEHVQKKEKLERKQKKEEEKKQKLIDEKQQKQIQETKKQEIKKPVQKPKVKHDSEDSDDDSNESNNSYKDSNKIENLQKSKSQPKENKSKEKVQKPDEKAKDEHIKQENQKRLPTYLDILKTKSDQKFLKERNDYYLNQFKNVKLVLHVVVEHHLTNTFHVVHQVYKDFKSQHQPQFQGSDQDFNSLFQDFFSPSNMVLRLELLRDRINKSKIKMETPLNTFYINTLPADKLIHLCYMGTHDEAKVIIDQYEKIKEEQRLKTIQIQQQNQERKKKKYMDEIFKKVFGESYDPQKVFDKNRQERAQPKDKWKLGKELLELSKKFPHDRVLQRMIQEEFCKNQSFKYPEEYDLFNQNIEQNFKKNFIPLDDQRQQYDSKIQWKIPDFKKEKTILDDFKARDIHERRKLRMQKREQLESEEALEIFLNEKALEYNEWMLKRHKANKKDKKTHRAYLSEIYQQMLLDHDEVTHQRFPHISYGQNPDSETFKKSFPESFKRYFFKIVKSIVRLKHGKKAKTQHQSTLILMAGARQITQQDPVDLKSFNLQLQAFQMGQAVRQLKRNDPKCWRTRVFKREDYKKKLKNIFMKVSELENCTFEPNAGALNINWKHVVQHTKEPRLKQESIPGEFFDRMGENFCRSNPQIYKQGKLKKAIIQFKNGDFELCFNIFCEGFDLTKIFQHFKPEQFRTWQDFVNLENDKSVSQKKSSPEKGLKQQKSEFEDIDQEQVDKIQVIFEEIDKKKFGHIKISELDEAFIKMGFTPNANEITDIEHKLEREGVKHIDLKRLISILTDKLKDKDREDSNKDLKKAFQIFDRDGDKQIDKNEFHFVIKNLDTDLTEREIQEMMKLADVDQNGFISEDEFIQVMASKKHKLKGSNYLSKMKQLIKKYLRLEELKLQFKKMGEYKPKMLSQAKEKAENELKLHPEKKIIYIEDFQNFKFKALYDEAWELLSLLFEREEVSHKRRNNLNKQQKILKKAEEALKEQEEAGGQVNDDDDNENDFKNMFKTIMCPLKNQCPKFKNLRWPSSSLKAITKFGKDCPYAHHPMELQFPQMLQMRIQGNKNSQKKEQPLVQKDFKYAGQLFECKGCGAHCNLCKYKKNAQTVLDEMKSKSHAMNIKEEMKEIKSKKDGGSDNLTKKEMIDERKKNNDNQRNMFAKKFGILKKASVLFFYGRSNDAFDEVAKAAQIIKNQKEVQKEVELNLQKRWQFKLGLPDGFELPKPIDKIRPEDVTDQFLKSIDSGGVVEKSTLKLYINNVCPLIRSQFDRDTFLNGLIEDLYFTCEDQMIEKKNTIEKISKNLEKLGEIQELMEALGSDADMEKDAEAFVDNEGNPLRVKKKKKKICEKVQMKKLYKDEGIEMKTADKYYIDAKYHKQITLDQKTETIKCVICPQGKACPHAHNAIELDLTPLNFMIKNLQGVVKTQQIQLKNDKPLEPWRPSAKNFSASDLPEYGQKPKKQVEGAEEQDDQVHRKGILARENVFRKPYEKE